MNENYRSHQWVIAAAESLVGSTALKNGLAANEHVVAHREPIDKVQRAIYTNGRSDSILSRLASAEYSIAIADP